VGNLNMCLLNHVGRKLGSSIASKLHHPTPT